MDSIGKVYLAIALVCITISLAGLWFLSKKTPKGTVLGVSVVIYIVGNLIDPGAHRGLYVLKGSIQIIGFLGGILGLIDLFAKKRRST